MYKYSIRLNGIDCPELRTKDALEKQYGQRAQQKLSELILHKYVRIEVLKFEKYGRILADVFAEDTGVSASDWILKNKYGVPYEGKTKLKFSTSGLAPL